MSNATDTVSTPCPCCGENRVDRLVWDEDCTVVTCDICSSVYDPSEYESTPKGVPLFRSDLPSYRTVTA